MFVTIGSVSTRISSVSLFTHRLIDVRFSGYIG